MRLQARTVFWQEVVAGWKDPEPAAEEEQAAASSMSMEADLEAAAATPTLSATDELSDLVGSAEDLVALSPPVLPPSTPNATPKPKGKGKAKAPPP